MYLNKKLFVLDEKKVTSKKIVWPMVLIQDHLGTRVEKFSFDFLCFSFFLSYLFAFTCFCALLLNFKINLGLALGLLVMLCKYSNALLDLLCTMKWSANL